MNRQQMQRIDLFLRTIRQACIECNALPGLVLALDADPDGDGLHILAAGTLSNAHQLMVLETAARVLREQVPVVDRRIGIPNPRQTGKSTKPAGEDN